MMVLATVGFYMVFDIIIKLFFVLKVVCFLAVVRVVRDLLV